MNSKTSRKSVKKTLGPYLDFSLSPLGPHKTKNQFNTKKFKQILERQEYYEKQSLL